MLLAKENKRKRRVFRFQNAQVDETVFGKR